MEQKEIDERKEAIGVSLFKYEELQAQYDLVRMDREKKIIDATPESVRKVVEDIEIEYADKLAAGEASLDSIKKVLQEMIKLCPEGTTVKGHMFSIQRSKTGRGVEVDALLKIVGDMAATGDPIILGYSMAISALISEAKPVGRLVKGGK